MATSEKDGGTATMKRMMAEMTPNASEQMALSLRLRKAMVPVRQCEPTRSVS